MVEICAKPCMEKKRMDPLQAVPLYDSLFCSISAVVIFAFSRAAEISTDLVLAVFNVSIKGTLSTNGTSVSFESSERSVSSSSFRVALFQDVSTMRFFLASSSSGRSYYTTSFSNQSRSPNIVTLKLMIMVLPKISGVQFGFDNLVVINILKS